MKKINFLYIAVLLMISIIALLTMMGAPDRVPQNEQELRDAVMMRLNRVHAEENKEADAQEKTDTDTPKTAEQPKKEDAMWPEEAPDVFKVKFECTNGDFIVECNKEWAPLGAERFYTLVRESFFDDSGFFRVVPNFVVQFGLAADPAITAKWQSQRLKDDPVTQSNLPGYITFATSGPNTRTTQLFINTGSNARLDGMGFAPFGKVIEGMEVVQKINAEYGERPQQGLITREGTAYLRKNFPNLDFIKSVTLVK